MMPNARGVGRRSFLAGITTLGAAAAAARPAPAAANTAFAGATTTARKLRPPSPALIAAEQVGPSTVTDSLHVHDPGSDFMVDSLRALGIDYVATMPSSSARGFHESLVNYGKGKPAIITCMHEEVAGGIAHGYAKASGKPMAILVHSTVGLQHASMAIYNAFCDRVPMLAFAGNILDETKRYNRVEWLHAGEDLATMVRGFVKHDAQPVSIEQFRDDVARAYAIATTPPMEPVLLVLDADVQENAMEQRLTPRPRPEYRPSAIDPDSATEIAKVLVAAENPVIVVDRAARTAEGVELITRFAEMLQAPVVDLFSKMNMANTHHLYQAFNQRDLIVNADAVLFLESDSVQGVLTEMPDSAIRKLITIAKPGVKVMLVNSELGEAGTGNFADFQEYWPADIAVAADAQASLPVLIDAVQRVMPPSRRAQNAQREAHFRDLHYRWRTANRELAARGWDAEPISVARLCMEIWHQIRHEDWSLVSSSAFQSRWPQRLWDFAKHDQYMGEPGAYGVGYQPPAAVGAALAFRGTGKIPVNICGDGEMMCAPTALWTAAHEKIPLLTIMHNNRGWHQETMFMTKMAARRDRDTLAAQDSTLIRQPFVDFGNLAKSMGVWGEGPITSPSQIGPAIARALQVVKRGEPALVDVVTEGR
ncbi:MAG TPA: thiamine pyrophosphate-binding protein [Candidatus Limnocylindria bacterium]|nr:thiamine pyrophosphate-binding protein [Candidatus Limnocylindria bacterium]